MTASPRPHAVEVRLVGHEDAADFVKEIGSGERAVLLELAEELRHI